MRGVTGTAGDEVVYGKRTFWINPVGPKGSEADSGQLLADRHPGAGDVAVEIALPHGTQTFRTSGWPCPLRRNIA